MKRFITIAEIRQMPLVDRVIVISSMVFIFGIGVAFSLGFYMKSGHWLSIVPAIGFYLLAWECKE